jgi:hypothetical protein
MNYVSTRPTQVGGHRSINIWGYYMPNNKKEDPFDDDDSSGNSN